MSKIKTWLGTLLCKIGLHDIEDSYCQRDGCDYHETNC